MNTVLYIVWNEKQSISIPILDEQHHAVVATINTLYFFINQGWGLSALLPTLKMVKSSVGFHLKTEEGILEKLGASETLLAPMILLKFLKSWWITHHEVEHMAYEVILRSITEKD